MERVYKQMGMSQASTNVHTLLQNCNCAKNSPQWARLRSSRAVHLYNLMGLILARAWSVGLKSVLAQDEVGCNNPALPVTRFVYFPTEQIGMRDCFRVLFYWTASGLRLAHVYLKVGGPARLPQLPYYKTRRCWANSLVSLNSTGYGWAQIIMPMAWAGTEKYMLCLEADEI